MRFASLLTVFVLAAAAGCIEQESQPNPAPAGPRVFSVEQTEGTIINASDSFIAPRLRWIVPIKIYLNTSGAAEEDIYRLRQAYKTWENASGNLIRFEETADPADAGITVRWTRRLNLTVSSQFIHEELGEATITEVINTGKFNLSRRGKIALLTRFEYSESCNPYEWQVPEHEVGHILGLAHSSDAENIMYPLQHGCLVIDNNTRNSLMELYRLPQGPDLSIKVGEARSDGPRIKINYNIMNHGLSGAGYIISIAGGAKTISMVNRSSLVLEPGFSTNETIEMADKGYMEIILSAQPAGVQDMDESDNQARLTAA